MFPHPTRSVFHFVGFPRTDHVLGDPLLVASIRLADLIGEDGAGEVLQLLGVVANPCNMEQKSSRL